MYLKAFALIGLLPLGSLGIKYLEFDCNKLPHVCTNMCWGAFCKNDGQGLIYDHPSQATIDDRRTRSGCMPNPNRCAQTVGHNCDEYPFASTILQGEVSATRVNRCVPSGENNSQGNQLMMFYGSQCTGSGDCSFDVGFANPGSSKTNYCQVKQGIGECINDGSEVTGPNKKKRDDSVPVEPLAARFLLASGKEIILRRSATIGDIVTRVVPLNGTLYDEQIEAGQRVEYFDNDGNVQQDDIFHNLVLQHDHIVKQLE